MPCLCKVVPDRRELGCSGEPWHLCSSVYFSPCHVLAPLSLPIPHLSGSIPLPPLVLVSPSVDAHARTPWTMAHNIHLHTKQTTPASQVSSQCSTPAPHPLFTCLPGCQGYTSWSEFFPFPGSVPPPSTSSALVCTQSVTRTCCP